MAKMLVNKEAKKQRQHWIERICALDGSFATSSLQLEQELKDELKTRGPRELLNHLRLCGTIPEGYKHDSSEEKLYSKYTDILISCAFRALGLKSFVLSERGDSADVECTHRDFSFVADAKAFRLTRTAKNVKDFKVQAMHGWKGIHLYAIVVCPLYQLPASASQIYMQAIERDVCIFSFSHLALLVALAAAESVDVARGLLLLILERVSDLNPTKDAIAYWQAVNRLMLEHTPIARDLWSKEKIAASEALAYAKSESLMFLSEERRRIILMNHDEAVSALLLCHRIDEKERTIAGLRDNGLMGAI